MQKSKNKGLGLVFSLLISMMLLLLPPVVAPALALQSGSEAEKITEPAPAKEAAAKSEPEEGQGARTGTAFVQEKTTQLKTILSTVDDSHERDRQLKELATAIVDYQELGRRSLRGNWDDISSVQQEGFVNLLRDLIEASYLKEAGSEPNFDLVVEDEEIEDDGAVTWVYTVARSGKTEFELEFRLMKPVGGKGDWIAYDLAIDGVSMVANYRKSFGEIIKKDGFDGLVSKMEKRLAEVKKDSKDSKVKTKTGAKAVIKQQAKGVEKGVGDAAANKTATRADGNSGQKK